MKSGPSPRGQDYGGKPRAGVIVEIDAFDAARSISICALSKDATEPPLFGLLVEPSQRYGLRSPSLFMVDKITTVPKSKIVARLGWLDDEDVLPLNRAMLVFLGLAGAPCATGEI